MFVIWGNADDEVLGGSKTKELSQPEENRSLGVTVGSSVCHGLFRMFIPTPQTTERHHEGNRPE